MGGNTSAVLLVAAGLQVSPRWCLWSHPLLRLFEEPCVNKIDGGDDTKVDCPSADCDELIPPHTVKELVPADVFERYDRLLLQRMLDGMQDVVYCPRPSCR